MQDTRADVLIKAAHDASGLSYLRNFICVNAGDLGDCGIELLARAYTSLYCFSYSYKPTEEEERIISVCYFATLSDEYHDSL